ncbi:peptide chain release factor N(5)-glutamine methyltransferase [Thalassotalea psychrophila]|uniref:Release factor glutamine methyltransferase n=1 Tax=Thalassotalea psychrophila TaxID=3065647 RepID=A0ABY9TQZ9_9GAMM|nr:peptide chain release factor N(5)-glutamine methyltransferase [Colwelliaceae bacterium SQ149]
MPTTNIDSSITGLTTIKQLFDYSKRCFLVFENDYDAKVDSQSLLASVLDKPISYLITWPEKQLTETQISLFDSFVKRRVEGEPVAFITGKREFWSLDFLVAPCTLIPRPDTEILVEEVLNNNPTEQLALLDLGTGTGAIALALASEHKQWQIEAVEYNQDAVLLAQTNAKQLNLAHVEIYQSDWFKAIDTNKRFNVIVSNPPYIAEDDKHLVEGDIRYEPKSALVAKDDGYADIRHIINVGRDFLCENGQMYLEHGFEQANKVQELFAEYGYEEVETINDFGGNPRITKAIKA